MQEEQATNSLRLEHILVHILQQNLKLILVHYLLFALNKWNPCVLDCW